MPPAAPFPVLTWPSLRFPPSVHFKRPSGWPRLPTNDVPQRCHNSLCLSCGGPMPGASAGLGARPPNTATDLRVRPPTNSIRVTASLNEGPSGPPPPTVHSQPHVPPCNAAHCVLLNRDMRSLEICETQYRLCIQLEPAAVAGSCCWPAVCEAPLVTYVTCTLASRLFGGLGLSRAE